MCLLLLAFQVVPQRPWLLLGNRDEFHGRASLAAAPWTDAPEIVGGRDVEAGGSWLALNRNGRFAAVTNVRTGSPRRGPRSRGELVADFVRGAQTPADYASSVAADRNEYGPFNLIVGDRSSAAGASSTRPAAWTFAAGVHVLSNGAPGAEWPKVRRLRERFTSMLQSGMMDNAATVGTSSPQDGALPAEELRTGAVVKPLAVEDALLDLLGDTAPAPDAELPDTGVGLELERRLAPIFLVGPQYGTRAGTLAYARDSGACVLVERGFGPNGVGIGAARIET